MSEKGRITPISIMIGIIKQWTFQKLQVDIFDDIQRQVMPVITAAGEEFGYTMIFNKFESGLVFAVEEIDLTDMILQRFNSTVSDGDGDGDGADGETEE